MGAGGVYFLSFVSSGKYQLVIAQTILVKIWESQNKTKQNNTKRCDSNKVTYRQKGICQEYNTDEIGGAKSSQSILTTNRDGAESSQSILTENIYSIVKIIMN